MMGEGEKEKKRELELEQREARAPRDCIIMEFASELIALDDEQLQYITPMNPLII